MLKMIIDCDTGIDDSLAILFALKRSDVKVLAITTGYGNVSVEEAADNSLRIIQLAGVNYEVPVALGARTPLTGFWSEKRPEIHGHNGLGDIELPPSSQKLSDEGAVDLIVRLARSHPGELTLVTLGRLTNLALALRQEPMLPHLLRSVVTMGGTLFHEGNVGPMAEANIAGDPEACNQVFEAGFNQIVIGLDVTMRVRFTPRYLELLQKHCKPENKQIARYITNVLQHYYRFNRVADGALGDCPLHDPTAMVAAVEPSVVCVRRMRARVETLGQYTRGMVVTDRRFKPMDAPYVDFALAIDEQRVLETFMSVFLEQDWFVS